VCDEKCAAKALAEMDAEEICILQLQVRDLQQAYSHVLELEQDRCREVVECQDKLSESQRLLKDVTEERDTWMQNFDDVAHRLADLQERIDGSSVAWASVYVDGSFCYLEKWNPDSDQEVSVKTVRYRLVPDPEEPDA